MIKLVKLNTKGFGLIESIVAIGLFLIIAVSGVSTVLHSYNLNRLGDQETQAKLYAQEGIEAVESLKSQDWANLTEGTYGLSDAGGTWSLSGSSDTSGKFTRVVAVEPVYRDSLGNIAASGSLDPDVWKVTATVTWNFTPARSNEINISKYFAHFEKFIRNNCDWSAISISKIGSYDMQKNADASSVYLDNELAFLVKADEDGADPEFAIVDVSNPSSPQVVNTQNLDVQIYDVVAQGSYVFLVTSDAGAELKIFDISNPSSPNISFASTDLNTIARTIFVDGKFLYVAGDSGGTNFYIYDISNLPSLSLLGSVNLGRTALSISANSSMAIVASDDDTAELMAIDTSDKANPQINAAWTYDAPNCASDGTGVWLRNTTGYLATQKCGGLDPEFHVLDLSDYKNSISLLGSYNFENDINDLYVNFYSQALLATNNVTKEFAVLDVSNPASISEINFADLTGTAFGLSSDLCLVAIAGSDNSQELELVGSGTPQPTPTPTPITSCSTYCQSLAYSTGTCRQNVNQCTTNGEVNEVGGNPYCNVGTLRICCCGN